MQKKFGYSIDIIVYHQERLYILKKVKQTCVHDVYKI